MNVGLEQPKTAEPSLSAGPDERLEDLSQIIRAYNQVTENLQRSHEALRQQVTRLQAELASTNAQLQRSKRLAALGEMAAGIAHEIRNPLGAIQLYAGMLTEDLTAAQTAYANATGDGPDLSLCADNARKIATAVRGLNGIVCDVLSFAREIKPRTTMIPVARLLDRAVEALQPMIDAADVEVRLSAAKDMHVCVDADLLHQALVNLVRNAIEAMSDSHSPSRQRTLTLSSTLEEGQVVLTVQDTGPGIAEADIDRIFNPFFTTRSTGTGLGLAIVHRIVDAHDGVISVHNAVEGGAVFELRLPAPPHPQSPSRTVAGAQA